MQEQSGVGVGGRLRRGRAGDGARAGWNSSTQESVEPAADRAKGAPGTTPLGELEKDASLSRGWERRLLTTVGEAPVGTAESWPSQGPVCDSSWESEIK